MSTITREASYSRFWKKQSVSLHTQNFAKGSVYTFQSYDGGPRTAIGHIVTHEDNICDVSNMLVPDEDMFNVSDHKPTVPQ